MLRRLAVGVILVGIAPGTALAATKTYSSGRLATPIHAGKVVEHPIRTPDGGPVSHAAVWLRVDHPQASALTISLVSPEGKAVVLSRRGSGGGRNFGAGRRDCGGSFTVFEDTLGLRLAESTPPYLGVHRPEQRLAGLNGGEAQGLWKLRIRAAAGHGAGTLLCWKLDLSATSSRPREQTRGTSPLRRHGYAR